MTDLYDLLMPSRKIQIVDIGANPIDGIPPYTPLLKYQLANVIGFEPQDDALAQLNQNKSDSELYLPYIVGNGEMKELKICRASGMTSLFEPDTEVLSLFEYLLPLSEVEKRLPVQTKKLDEIDEISYLDFLKIDIQGGELDVFQSGHEKLKNAVMIQTEVSFMTLYKDQPSFGAIDLELRQQGFVPHCFAAVKNWPIAPMMLNNNPMQGLNQLLEADIVYVKDFTKPDLISNEQFKHIALIAHYCYGSFDLSLNCIYNLVLRNELPVDAMDQYLLIMQKSNS